MRLVLAAVAFLAVAAATAHGPAASAPCTPGASWSYAEGVGAATRSGRDVWGEQLLAARNGPTFEAAHRFLAPILYATQRGRLPLTPSHVYYLPLAYPTAVGAPASFALHVADGSEIFTRRVTGPHVSVYVGRTGRERYGSCLARTQTATLVDGYLPIMLTSYTDAGGVRYTQESFASRLDGARSIVSFVHLTVDASDAKRGAVVRFVTSTPGRLVVVRRGPMHVAAGTSADIYMGWLHKLPLLHPIKVNETTYERARSSLITYWQNRLAQGTQLLVPEERVQDAEKSILIQQLVQGWRYSAGNPYEELSYAEAMDTVQVMAEYGYRDDAEGILRMALQRLPLRFSSWRAGDRLLASAVYYDLFKDRAYLGKETPALGSAVAKLDANQLPDGRLPPEPLSSDVPGAVDGVPAQVVAWQGLLAISRVWSVTGHRDLAARARSVALRLEHGLDQALAPLVRRPGDGSLFVPSTLTPTAPYPRITATRDGSYWNLVMPYAFASGFFPPGSADAKGILAYLLAHGSRMLGVSRADAHIAYGRYIVGDGLAEVYSLAPARFIADNDLPDQLTLSLYGMLAIGMTQGTYVSGEAISALPVGTAYYRTMYMPPNLGANSSFLETLRLLLVHERRGRFGAPRGLDLAFSTPRLWLADGDTLGVQNAPTSFGTLTYSVTRDGKTLTADLRLPRTPTPTRLRFRLPAGLHVAYVALGRRRLPFDHATGTVTLRGAHGHLTLRVQLR